MVGLTCAINAGSTFCGAQAFGKVETADPLGVREFLTRRVLVEAHAESVLKTLL